MFTLRGMQEITGNIIVYYKTKTGSNIFFSGIGESLPPEVDNKYHIIKLFVKNG